MTSPAENITRHFKGDWHGSYGSIPTPGHSAKDRGTTVTMGANGEVLFHAHNEPSLDWRGLKDECRQAGLLPDRERASNSVGGSWRETGSYSYRDAAGNVLYRTVRKEKLGEGKRFEAQRLDGRRWINGMGDAERVLYRLPELLAADPAEPVYFVEGERKADRLAEWGFVATAIAFGCKGWRDSYAANLSGRKVVILPDNDDAGRSFAQRVKDSVIAAGGAATIAELPGLPPKGDIIDWKGTPDDLRAMTQVAVSKPVETFPLADLAMWSATAATPKTFVMAGFVPAHELTLATGAGGANKSTFGQQLATCVAAGLPMLGVDVQQGSALYITAEDDESRLHWMQEHICKALGARMDRLSGKLHLVSLRGRLGNELATFDADGRLRPTPSFSLLKATIAATRPKLLVLDNAAHLFAGNENDRGQVTAFVNLLYSLTLEFGVTIMLVAHANKAGDSYSGSTAWLNAVRSQIVLARPEGSEDPDERVLTLGKANYARQGEELRFRWHDFALRLAGELPADLRDQYAATAKAASENIAFLACLREREKQGEGRAVGPAPGPNYAPTQFEGMPQAKGLKKERLKAAMDRLFSIGAIESYTYRNTTKGRDVTVIRETSGGVSPNPERHPRTPPEHSSRTTPNTSPEVPRAHSLPLKGDAGAAFSGPAPAAREDNARSIDWSRFEKPRRANGSMILAPGETGDDVEF